jgi:hypothetical protein
VCFDASEAAAASARVKAIDLINHVRDKVKASEAAPLFPHMHTDVEMDYW